MVTDLINFVFGIWYLGSSGVTPQHSSLKKESWWGLGISGREVLYRSGVGHVGISGGYISVNWHAMKLEGASKYFVEVVAYFLTSRMVGSLGNVGFFPILYFLSIN